MKNEIIKVKYVKPIRKKLYLQFYLQVQVITDACIEIGFEMKTKESIVGTFENVSAIGVHYWYLLLSLEFEGYLKKFVSFPEM